MLQHPPYAPRFTAVGELLPLGLLEDLAPVFDLVFVQLPEKSIHEVLACCLLGGGQRLLASLGR